MKPQPVLILGLDGETPVQPIQASDLEPIATDYTLGQVSNTLSAIKSLLSGQMVKGSTVWVQVVQDLSAPLADEGLDTTPLTRIHRVRVKDLVGAASMKPNTSGNPPIDLAVGDDLYDLNIAQILLSTDGSAGGTITLQVFGDEFQSGG